MEVIYSPSMVAPDQSFSPSAAKAAAVMAAWREALPDLVVSPPHPATMAAIEGGGFASHDDALVC